MLRERSLGCANAITVPFSEQGSQIEHSSRAQEPRVSASAVSLLVPDQVGWHLIALPSERQSLPLCHQLSSRLIAASRPSYLCYKHPSQQDMSKTKAPLVDVVEHCRNL